MSQNLGALGGELIIITVVAAGSLLVLSGSLTIGGLAACTLLSGRALQPLMRTLSLWYQYQSVAVSRDRLQKTLDFPPERSDDAMSPVALSGDVELSDVAFSYDDDPSAPPLFSGINLHVRPGEAVGIHGGNGAGKSTLLWLLAGSLKPTNGHIFYDKADSAEYNAMSLRHQVAYLPQRGVLFRGTLMENLTTFRGSQSISRAVNLTKALGLDEVVARLPDGFDTRIEGDSTSSLSGGVRQQIAIIRALLNNPKVILFDEANLGLDQPANEKLRDFLAHIRGQLTMVLVSHRPSILGLADRIFELRQDGLFEAGLPQSNPSPAGAHAHGEGRAS